MKRKMKDKRGFTLMEAIIAVLIIAILSALSGPIYKKYILEAKKAEGYALLGTILSRQQNYYNEYGTYLFFKQSSSDDTGFTCNEEVLGIDARNCKHYTCFRVGNVEADLARLRYMFTSVVKSDLGDLQMVYNNTAGGATFK